MSREILFRAKRKDDDEWVEGNLITNERCQYKKYIGYIFDESGGVIEDFHVTEVIPDTVCQYTGLTDRYGKKIWENDIVSIDEDYCFNGPSVVKFGRYKDIDVSDIHKCRHIGFYLDHISQFAQRRRQDIMFFCPKCEVVGDIFDNPEFLNFD